MTKKENPDYKPANCVSVESINESIERVKKHGGKIISPKPGIPNVGWIAIASDSERNHTALLQPQHM